MSTNEAPAQLPHGIQLQLLPPRSARLRNRPPEWEVLLNGKRIGRIEQWSVSSSSSTFYRATAIHPQTGELIPLESNTDFPERVEKVVAAWNNPARFVHRSSWE